MNTIKASLLMALLISPLNAIADVDFSVLTNPQINQYQPSGLFSLPKKTVKQPEWQSKQIVEWRGDYQGVNLLGDWQYSIDEDGTENSKGSMLEAYYSNTFKDIDFSIGKKITSWGVAYGFKPIDIIANQDLQTTTQLSQEGVAQLALDYYTGLGSISLVVAPNTYQGNLNAIRYYQSMDEADVQTVIAHSTDYGWQLGVAGVWIATDSLAIHGEILSQENYSKSINSLVNTTNPIPISTTDPFKNQTYTKGVKWLAGLNYSWGSHNLIAEYWFNPLAYTTQQWQGLFDLAKKQKNLKGKFGLTDEAIYGNLAYDLSAMQTTKLMQHNVFLRWAYEGDDWKPSVSVLYAPEDKGVMLTLATTREFNWFKLNAGVRRFTGDSASVYAQLFSTGQIYATLSRDF